MGNEQEKEKPAKIDVNQIKAENISLKKQIAELQKQIAELKAPKPAINIKGFLLNVDDPFGIGTIRDYRKAGGKTAQPDNLPFVLPENEEASKKALKMYIVRAAAGGDKNKVKAAQEALK